MTNPDDELREQLADDPGIPTGFQRGMDQIGSLGVQASESDPIETYKQEPLFSKKVLFGWGLATLFVWFMITTIVPSIFHAVTGAIKESVVESGDNAQTIIKTRNGTTITINKGRNGGISVTKNGREILNTEGSAPAAVPERPAQPERVEQPERPVPPERIEPKERPETAPPATTGKK